MLAAFNLFYRFPWDRVVAYIVVKFACRAGFIHSYLSDVRKFSEVFLVEASGHLTTE